MNESIHWERNRQDNEHEERDETDSQHKKGHELFGQDVGYIVRNHKKLACVQLTRYRVVMCDARPLFAIAL